MKCAKRVRTRAAIAAVLLLCAADPGSGDAGEDRGGGPSADSGGGTSVLLSLKISGAKKRNREVSFYKSVARQGKAHAAGKRGTTGDPGRSTER